MDAHAASAVVMVKPAHFYVNPETAADNSFQRPSALSDTEVARRAAVEVEQAAQQLSDAGVNVLLFDDPAGESPDSVFPNNWMTTHWGGRVAVFPMYAPNRRKERRWDIIEILKQRFHVREVIDYSGLEHEGMFLEGTGAMVLDHAMRIAYVAKSRRTNSVVLGMFCRDFNYTPVEFHAFAKSGQPIYHTNVLMNVASDFVAVGLACIPDTNEQDRLCVNVFSSNRTLLPLRPDQITHFAGNALELRSRHGHLLYVLSQTAYSSLDAEQLAIIRRNHELLPIAIPTIELGGGSIRCMLADIHLQEREQETRAGQGTQRNPLREQERAA